MKLTPFSEAPRVLERLQAVGLFRGAGLKAFAAAMAGADGPFERFDPDSEQWAPKDRPSIEDRVLPPKARKLLEKTNPELLLHAPQSADELAALMSRQTRRNAALVGPAPRVKLEDVRSSSPVLTLEVDGAGTSYPCPSLTSLVGVFNEALTRADDERRLVLLKEEDEPSCFALVTPDQHAVLDELGLVDRYGSPRLPEPLVPGALVCARTVLGQRERCQEAAAVFRLGDEVPVRAGIDGFPDQPPIFERFPCVPGIALVVLSGFGGQQSGNIACEVALEALGAGLRTRPPEDRQARHHWLQGIIVQTTAHLRMAAAAPTVGERPGARRASGRRLDVHSTVNWGGGGVSAAVAVMIDRTLLLAHSGNVRATLRRAHPRGQVWSLQDLLPLTTDDSLLEDARSVGQLNTLADHRFAAAQVTRALGYNDECTIAEHELAEGDVLMLASHGLYSELDPGVVERILTREAPGTWSLMLALAAKTAGRNVTVLTAIVRDRDFT